MPRVLLNSLVRSTEPETIKAKTHFHRKRNIETQILITNCVWMVFGISFHFIRFERGKILFIYGLEFGCSDEHISIEFFSLLFNSTKKEILEKKFYELVIAYTFRQNSNQSLSLCTFDVHIIQITSSYVISARAKERERE